MDEPIGVLCYDDDVYVNVVEFMDMIIKDLQKAPIDMVATRDEIIFAMQRYKRSALEAADDARK